MDILSVLGIIIALGSIVGGQHLEGGHLSSILQFTAFFDCFWRNIRGSDAPVPALHFFEIAWSRRYGLWQREGGYERGDYPGRGII